MPRFVPQLILPPGSPADLSVFAAKAPLVLLARYMESTTLGFFSGDVVFEEQHEDNYVITEHPVQQGSTVSDHAYRQPARLRLVYAWALGSKQNAKRSYDFLRATYQAALDAQAGRELVMVGTGKRLYNNMLIESLGVTTDQSRENILELRITLKEVIFTTVTIQDLQVPTNMASPEQTATVTKQGDRSPQPPTNLNQKALPPEVFDAGNPFTAD